MQTTDPGVTATDAVGDAANDTATGVDSQQAPSAGDDGGAVTTRQS